MPAHEQAPGTCGKTAFQRENSHGHGIPARLWGPQALCYLGTGKSEKSIGIKVHGLTPELGTGCSSMQFQQRRPAAGFLHFWSCHGKRSCPNTHICTGRLFPGCPGFPHSAERGTSTGWAQDVLSPLYQCPDSPAQVTIHKQSPGAFWTRCSLWVPSSAGYFIILWFKRAVYCILRSSNNHVFLPKEEIILCYPQ